MKYEQVTEPPTLQAGRNDGLEIEIQFALSSTGICYRETCFIPFIGQFTSTAFIYLFFVFLVL